jgi:thymidylate synthase (FAD)
MVKATLDVIAQWRRHRTCTFVNWNQESLRYSEASDDFYVPDVLRPQSSTNKQGRDDNGIIDAVSQQKFKDLLRARKPHQEYSTALEAGVARETARLILPTNLYSTFVFTVDLSNLLNFLQLRVDPHAQYEIRQYALAIYDLIKPLVPLTIAAWEDYELHAITFTVPELTFLMDCKVFRSGLDSLDWDDKSLLKDCGLENQRELSELKAKINKMFDSFMIDSDSEPELDTITDNDDRPISPYGSGSDSESSNNECDSDCICTECTMLLQRKYL